MVDVTAPFRRFLPYWLFSAGVFLVTVIFGAAAGVGDDTSSTLPAVQGGFRFGELTVSGIFYNNVGVVLLMLFGLVFFGIPTLYLLGWNGLTIGVVIISSMEVNGVVPTFVALLPHGVIELPAVWLGSATVFRLLHAFWRLAQGEKLPHPAFVYVVESLLALVVVVFLLLLAAAVEVWITPRVLRLVI